MTYNMIFPFNCKGLKALFLIMIFIVNAGKVIPAPLPSGSKSSAIEDARALLLSENFNAAISEYAKLTALDTTNAVLNSEFAYALALGGIYDAALYRIDRTRALQPQVSEADFYSAEILALMGFDELASEFRSSKVTEGAPAWISSKAPEFINKYRRADQKSLGESDIAIMFSQANIFAARNSVLQSVALFRDITTSYPYEYLPYLGYSIALEKAGLMKSSEQAVRNALEIVGQDASNQDAREALERRLSSLEGSAAKPQGKTASQAETVSPAMMAYGGGYVASSFVSLTAKAGIFLSDQNYVTLEGGVTNSGAGSYANLGLSIYNRQGIYVMGGGFTSNLGGSASVFYVKLSVGLSFMNKNKTSSLDIFLDGKTPLSKGYPTMMGLSIGQSFYFGNRK